jgi:transposase
VTPERERWAEALAVERAHGSAAAAHIAHRVAVLAAQGDIAGVTRWRQIAARYDALQTARYADAMPVRADETISGSSRE